MTRDVWVNGKRRVTGHWTYHWAPDRFTITLDQKDRITGENKRLVVAGDKPEWGNWKLLRDASANVRAQERVR